MGQVPLEGVQGVTTTGGCRIRNDPDQLSGPGRQRTAATYSPTWWGSTIGEGGLNFSVRNGKRWIPAAIATAVYVLRKITGQVLDLAEAQQTSLTERFRAISTGRLNTSLCVHLLPINVVVSHDPKRKSHLEDGFALRCFQRLS